MIYEYQCPKCGDVIEDVRTLEEGFKKRVLCRRCRKWATKIFSKFVADTWKPHWEHNIAANPVKVESKRQYREILKQNDLVEA